MRPRISTTPSAPKLSMKLLHEFGGQRVVVLGKRCSAATLRR